MAQSSVAREPSMEEILASIRQIIESNEPGAGRSISTSLPPVYGDEEDIDSDIHLTVDEAYAGVEFPEPVTRSDPRFVAANSSGSVPEPEMQGRAMSLADVAARVRAASERHGAPLRQPSAQVQEPSHAVEQQHLARNPVEDAPLRGASDPVRAVPQMQAEPPTMVTAAHPEPAEEQPEATKQDVAAASAPHQVHEMDAQTQRSPADALQSMIAEQTSSLISETAGLQISRSFEELAAAIDGAERRSLDQIAEDLLRPMLQEWLDDNLPPLVERLVREEIERVARGPRR